jgi:hypothetical protein
MATLIAIDWLVIVIGLLFKCSLNVYVATFAIKNMCIAPSSNSRKMEIKYS